MKKNMYIVSMILSAVFTYSCNKADSVLKDESKTKNNSATNSNARLSGNEGSTEYLDYLMNFDMPTRDVTQFIKNGGSLPITKHFDDFKALMRGSGIGNGSFPYVCSNNLIVLGYPGATCGGSSSGLVANSTNNALDCPTYILDSWSNKIHAIASYGNNDRQGYYVYLPNNFNTNSPIVVLIHGGGWSSGPDPSKVNGFNSVYTQYNLRASNNLVKNLLLQGYVVVAPLYRLVQIGYNNVNSDWLVGNISVQDQINDIDACITHVRTNFPTCLDISANSIQVLGESAGGHLAMMYAYTKANTSFVKSVVSVSGPANMNQMANYIWKRPKLFNSGNDYIARDPNLIPKPTDNHFGFYGLYDPAAAAQGNVVAAMVNPPTTPVGNTKLYRANLSWISPTNPVDPVITPTILNFLNGIKVADNYNVAQSLVHQTITNPLTNTALATISPCVALNASRIVPTFLITGSDDWVVPYQYSDSTMDVRFSAVGGLIGTYTTNGIVSSPSNIPTSYTGLSSKHIIKIYGHDGTYDADSPLRDGHSNHDVANNKLTQPDIITWLNGHK